MQHARTAIANGELDKVVLARDQLLWARRPFDTAGVLRQLSQRFPTCTTFLVDNLVGASPEMLLEQRGRRIRSVVLAGTAPRSEDPTEDSAILRSLLRSRKDLMEHELAVRSVSSVLSETCDVTRVDGPQPLQLHNVQHLASTVTAVAAPRFRSLDLVEALHPTAAVAGTPRAEALSLIALLEQMDRDRYAGPVGWIDASGDGDWAIALRCALVQGATARLFAGAGIMAASLPEAELMETWHKLNAMRGALM